MWQSGCGFRGHIGTLHHPLLHPSLPHLHLQQVGASAWLPGLRGAAMRSHTRNSGPPPRPPPGAPPQVTTMSAEGWVAKAVTGPLQ